MRGYGILAETPGGSYAHQGMNKNEQPKVVWRILLCEHL